MQREQRLLRCCRRCAKLTARLNALSGFLSRAAASFFNALRVILMVDCDSQNHAPLALLLSLSSLSLSCCVRSKAQEKALSSPSRSSSLSQHALTHSALFFAPRSSLIVRGTYSTSRGGCSTYSSSPSSHPHSLQGNHAVDACSSVRLASFDVVACLLGRAARCALPGETPI